MLAFREPERREELILDACAEFPGRRESWCELAQLHYDRARWRACRAAAYAALRIEEPADEYLANPLSWGPWPEQLAARASLRLGETGWAVHHARRPLRLAPRLPELADLLKEATTALVR